MEEKQEVYCVVFVKTREHGAYEGIRMIKPFRSKEDFNKWRQKEYTEENQKKETIIAKGITIEQAEELCKQTPLACLIAAAFQRAKEASGPTTPTTIRTLILSLELGKVLLLFPEISKLELTKFLLASIPD